MRQSEPHQDAGSVLCAPGAAGAGAESAMQNVPFATERGWNSRGPAGLAA